MQDVYASLEASLGPIGACRTQKDPYELILVRGPDAADFLHRLCSQDVLGLELGSAAPAAFLNPKGKLVATATIGRIAADGYLVETRAALAARLFELLDRYHFTEKLTLARDDTSAHDGIRGPGALAHADVAAWRAARDDDGLTVLAGVRHGVGWVRWHGPAASVAAAVAGVPARPDLAECLRIQACDPRVGVDTEDGTLALEADLDDHVSTSKGCYTGQEIVARIHTYGHVNRKLTRLVIDAADDIPVGTALVDVDLDERVGRVMSSALLPDGARRIALGYLPDGFADDPATLAVGAADGPRAQVWSFEPA